MLVIKSDIFSHNDVDLRYVQKGEHPQWLIHTGTHGDETGVINSGIKKIIYGPKWQHLPDFLWVLETSPSACEQKTRFNKYGHDLNRMFKDSASDPEVLANLAILEKYSAFETFISIHEDPDHFNSFYLYDSQDLRHEKRLEEFFTKLFAQGIHAFNGIDDPRDPTLGNHIQNGYCVLSENLSDGTTFDYFRRIGRVTRRCLNPEIPGRAEQAVKDFIIETFFDYLLSS